MRGDDPIEKIMEGKLWEHELGEIIARDTERLYNYLGRFVVGFSMVCSELAGWVNRSAMNQDEGSVAAALVGEMHAQQLSDVAFLVAREARELTESEQAVLRALRKQVNGLIVHRNDLMHGGWSELIAIASPNWHYDDEGNYFGPYHYTGGAYLYLFRSKASRAHVVTQEEISADRLQSDLEHLVDTHLAIGDVFGSILDQDDSGATWSGKYNVGGVDRGLAGLRQELRHAGTAAEQRRPPIVAPLVLPPRV